MFNLKRECSSSVLFYLPIKWTNEQSLPLVLTAVLKHNDFETHADNRGNRTVECNVCVLLYPKVFLFVMHYGEYQKSLRMLLHLRVNINENAAGKEVV